jgi:hypothetical protein
LVSVTGVFRRKLAKGNVGDLELQTGAWGQRFHDLPERGAGPEIGDYLGLPINDAARLRADSWDAGKWTMLERQCEPHPADYARGQPPAYV